VDASLISQLKERCEKVPKYACERVRENTKKDFSKLDWQTNVLAMSDVSWKTVASGVSNRPTVVPMDGFVKSLIMAVPLQIARGTENEFSIMHNGVDDQSRM